MFKSKNDTAVVYKCTIRLLEDSEVLECKFQSIHKGIYLIENICKQLDIKEKDYFGLRYVDIGNQRHWLDLSKSIIKQCKDVDPIIFSFRVKFYPADPYRLTENSRLTLYQQLKRDLRHGRLYCSIGEAAALGALIVQEELGDYDEEIHIGDYVSSMHLALRQTAILEKKIMELHRKREPNQNAFTAMDEFISIARGLETYGIDPHFVKDHRSSQLYIGINHSGISTFVLGKRSQHFRWNEVHKINFEGKMFIAHLSYTDSSREPKKHTIGFKCVSGPACRYIWRCAIEQMLFFTLPNSQNASVISGGGFFSWGTKFKYTGRTEREILTENINALRQLKNSSAASNRKASSVPATPSSPQCDLAQIRYSSLPRSTLSEPLNNMPGNVALFENNNQILEPVSEESRYRFSNLSTNNDFSDYFFQDLHDDNLQDKKLPLANRQLFYNNTEKKQLSSTAEYHSFRTTLQANTPGRVSNLITKSENNKLQQNNINNYRSVRRFHLLSAFIPSFCFVVFVMAVSALLILESELEVFEQIRNMPEMISLKYQYQLLKEFIFHKFGRKK